jgi:hypothetical protein
MKQKQLRCNIRAERRAPAHKTAQLLTPVADTFADACTAPSATPGTTVGAAALQLKLVAAAHGLHQQLHSQLVLLQMLQLRLALRPLLLRQGVHKCQQLPLLLLPAVLL